MRRIDFIALVTRLFLGYLFFSSGLCKLTDGEFGQLIGPPHLINTLAPYGLAGFALFIATAQVLTGALVFSQRYSLLGLVTLMPINSCILAVTISQQWQGTPYIDAFFLLMNVLVLLYEWPVLKMFLVPESVSNEMPRTNQLFTNRWLPLGVLLIALLAVITARYNAHLTILPGLVCFGLTYANIWTNRSLHRLDRAVLVISLVAIVGVTLSNQLLLFHINPVVWFTGSAVLSVGLFMISLWQSYRQPIA
ncbi:hypothetical protein [Spirosoma oryzicola]|uniref:hypothetical protein n=1 Tax=Spirosoma oryzicola TaxID=2898794 RepID=UPI001E3680F1|nr:hypothetical protein [Spirosoma oryzicola]UHG94144.1 hypothetical protein LQ777_25750 [Spirosoma oryzicola]